MSLGFSYATVTPGPPVPARQLPLTIQVQQESLWCWAAISSSVDDFYAIPPSWQQCCIVQSTFASPLPPPCISPTDPAWNRTAKLSPALRLVGHQGPSGPGAYGIAQIRSQIDSDQPLGVAIQWNGSSNPPDNHFVLLTGYSDDGTQPEVTVKDPFNGTTLAVPLRTFPAKYRSVGGTWIFSYETKP